jgi:hypothetical protein
MNNAISRGWRPTFLLGALLLAGCAQPGLVEETYGDSVRHMVDAQIYDRAAALDPEPKPVLTLDGEKGEVVLKTHREAVSKPEEVPTPILLEIGKK